MPSSRERTSPPEARALLRLTSALAQFTASVWGLVAQGGKSLASVGASQDPWYAMSSAGRAAPHGDVYVEQHGKLSSLQPSTLSGEA